MNNYYTKAENLEYTEFDSFQKPNVSNAIPKSWKKFGEVYSNKFKQAVFVCLICLEKADCINNAYTICDGADFWAHIQQQHISKEFETIANSSAELQTNCARTVKDDSNIAEPTDLNVDKMEENQIQLLDKFHENVVNNESSQLYKNNMILDIEIEGSNTNEDIKPIFKDETNQKYDSNFLNCNYFYEETDSFTISDDEEKDDDDKKDEIQKTLAVNSNRRETDFLRHNDRIEISDDEDDKEFIDIRPESPFIFHDNKIISEVIITDDISHPEDINSSDIKESLLYRENDCAINSVSCIPTPDISPCESLSNQQCNSSLNFQYINQATGYDKETQSNKFQQHSKKRVRNFRSFQCKVCHKRTINEKTMQNHIERLHGSLLQDIGPHKVNNQQYHRVQQLHQHNQPDLPQSCVSLKAQNKLVKCKSCKTRTATIKGMERHQRIYHSPDSHLLAKQCQICQKRVLQEKLQQHMQFHNSTEFQCIYCGVEYKHKHYLNSHINKYHADKNVRAVPKYPPRFATNFSMSNDLSNTRERTPNDVQFYDELK